MVLEHLCTDKDKTIVFEDVLYAIETAKSAGYIVAGIYDKAEVNQNSIRALSDFYIIDFSKLEDIL